jgi:putative Ca2+/H+ antiporter (TMEM165/GDT1 family)
MLHFDPKLFVSTFALIFVAELPDKTALAVLIMATRNHPVATFLGVALAFLVQTVIAVCFGRFFGLLPEHWVHLASGVLFLGFAGYAFIAREEAPEEASKPISTDSAFARVVLSAFVVIFIAEWGDLTQLATATLVAKYPHGIFTLFWAALLALWAVSAVAIVIGRHAKDRLNPVWLNRAASAAFALVGILILCRG